MPPPLPRLRPQYQHIPTAVGFISAFAYCVASQARILRDRFFDIFHNNLVLVAGLQLAGFQVITTGRF
jgi:hypothetical protein